MIAASRQQRPQHQVRLAISMLTLALLATSTAHSGEPLPPRTGRLHLQATTYEQIQFRGVTAHSSRWRTPSGPLDVDADDLLAWGLCPAPLVGPSAVLHGGGVLAGELAAWTEHDVTIASPLVGQVRIPHAAIARWQATAGTPPAPTTPGLLTLQLINGDTLLASSFALPAGATTGLAAPAAQSAGSPPLPPVRIPRNRLLAILRGSGPEPAPRLPQPTTAVAVLGLEDGSHLAVEKVEALAAADGGGMLAWPLVAGDLHLPPLPLPPDAVTGLVATGGHAIPLAWLAASDFEQTPLFGPPWPYTIGSTLSGGPLTARGLQAFTGFGLHAKARLTYELPAATVPQRLLASVAIDDTAGQGGSVVIRVRGGSEPTTLQLLFESPVLRGGDAPLPLDVNMGDSRWLELSVDPTDDGDALDRTVWLEPRLVRRQTSRSVPRGPSPAASDASRETSPGRR